MGSPEIKRLQEKLSKEILWVYILAVLKEGDSHAYVLRKKISERFGFLPGNVSSYVVLYKLESRGFVLAKMDGNKKVYSVTQKGRELAKEAKVVFGKKLKEIF